MKTVNRFILLLILGTTASCENSTSFEHVVRDTMCTLQCPDKQCVRTCMENTREMKIIDVEAGANATLDCRDVKFIRLAHNPGPFVIERRLINDSVWSNAVISQDTSKILPGLAPGSSYKFRLHRIFDNGISTPEITEEINTMQKNETPMQVRNISQSYTELEADDPCHLRTEISFIPADENRSCYYEVLYADAISRTILIDLNNSKEYNVIFPKLEFDIAYTVEVTALTRGKKRSSSTSTNFHTPTCLEVYNNLTMCAPGMVEGLNATTTHKMNKIYDVIVTWDVPELIPDYYEVKMYAITAEELPPVSYNVSGTKNNIIFPNIRIVEQFDVHIMSWSLDRAGPSVYKRFSIPEIPEDLVNVPGAIALTFLVSLVFVVGTGVYVYRRHQKRKRSHQRSKYFECLGQTDVALESTKGIGEPTSGPVIAAVKRLLTPVEEYEIDPERLEIKRILGSGAFGVVKLGSLRDHRGQVITVAIKMLRDNPSEEDFRSFDLEIKLMKSAKQHPNIVSLLGCCTIGPRPLLVVEYCSRGDLQSFLRTILEKATLSVSETKKQCASSSRSTESNKTLEDNYEVCLFTLASSDADPDISSCVANRAYNIDRDAFYETDMVTLTDLLNFGRQIATGMEFLSSNRIVHRDLAARNVLVCEDRTVKISDFGLSRDIYQENVYKKQGNGRLPVKWMAIEALTHQVYSIYSDVWSFGILLWEIVTLGSSPYPDIPANGVLKRLRSGYRMERPANCSVPLYNVMLSCWQTKPRDRPTFTVLRQELDKLICIAANHEYLDLHYDSKMTSTEDEDSRISNLHYTCFPPQPKYVNDVEPKVIHEYHEIRKMPRTEKCTDSCDKYSEPTRSPVKGTNHS